MIQELHRMTLRAPWQCSRTDATSTFQRGFGRPRQLSTGEALYLEIGPLSAACTVECNNISLGVVPVGEVQLFPLPCDLPARNLLALHLNTTSSITASDTPPVAIVVCQIMTDRNG
jgi:hypothetical protein